MEYGSVGEMLVSVSCRVVVLVLAAAVVACATPDPSRTQRPVRLSVAREEPTTAAVGAFAWCRNQLQLTVLFEVVMGDAKLKQSRAAMKGWVTNYTDKLSAHLKKKPEDVDVNVLKFDLENLTTRLCKLDDAQSLYEVTIEQEADMLSDIGATAPFREKSELVQIQATKLYKKLTKPVVDQGDLHVPSDAGSQSVHSSKLPKLELPQCDGEAFESFWDVFEVEVHDRQNLPKVSKFSYLKKCCVGKAAQAIEGLSPTDADYDTAIAILTQRFGRKEVIIFRHVKELLEMPVPTTIEVDKLWQLNDSLLAHTRALEKRGITGASYGVILTPMLLSKFPEELRIEWGRVAEGKESDLAFLMEFLAKEIKSRERSVVFQSAAVRVEESQQ